MNEDLNISKALSVLFDFIKQGNKAGGGEKARKFILKINQVLGLKLEEKQEVPNEIKKLVKEREKARKNKDWKKADKIRELNRIC